MNKELFTNFDKEDLKAIIIEAIKEANSILLGNNYQENSTEDYLDQREAAKFLRITPFQLLLAGKRITNSLLPGRQENSF